MFNFDFIFDKKNMKFSMHKKCKRFIGSFLWFHQPISPLDKRRQHAGFLSAVLNVPAEQLPLI